MMSLMLALALFADPPGVKVEVAARASVKVLRGQPVSKRSWNPQKQPSQREIVKQEADGSKRLIRLTEFQ